MPSSCIQTALNWVDNQIDAAIDDRLNNVTDWEGFKRALELIWLKFIQMVLDCLAAFVLSYIEVKDFIAGLFQDGVIDGPTCALMLKKLARQVVDSAPANP